MTRATPHQELRELIRRCFEDREKPPFLPGRTRIPLNIPSFGWEEIWEALDSLLSTQVTMGNKVRQFEAMFAEYIGVRHAIMVNSGSSANLLALSILTNPLLPGHLQPGDEVITPAVTWATTVFPILNVGLVPVLVDVDLRTFNLIPEEVEKAISPKSRAILLVHLLGNPCDMDEIMAIARRHKLLVVEDACEAHGAEYDGRKVGSFGDIATFSFFFSHHITTIEGGMLLTNNDEYAELARALRVFGWIRDLKAKDAIAKQHPEVDPRFLFVNIGYNLRPTEIQGAFGIHQMAKLEGYIETRRENARYWGERLGALNHLVLHREAEGTRHVWFGYPVMVRPDAPFSRGELVDYLEARGVETRPIMAGNIDEQPALRLFSYRKVGELPNSRLIHRNAFFFGNHHGIGREEREAIAGYIKEFVANRG
ncbi:MAG: DegT/DnrJ/EryC1/StrS family aminotransferase [Dehalococcoidia bacterium]|nr:DegT/DnrJ/EryC1/StrS family aminotransferase [Dehalococcoidia bacterium]